MAVSSCSWTCGRQRVTSKNKQGLHLRIEENKMRASERGKAVVQRKALEAEESFPRFGVGHRIQTKAWELVMLSSLDLGITTQEGEPYLAAQH